MMGIIIISEQIHYKLNEVEIIIFKDARCSLILKQHSHQQPALQPMRHLMENGFKWWFDELVFSISLLLTVGWVSLILPSCSAGCLLLQFPKVCICAKDLKLPGG